MNAIFKIQDGDYITSIPVTLEEDGTHTNIFAPYNPQIVTELKAMEGAKWNPDDKHWTVKNNERNTYAFECLRTNSQVFVQSIRKTCGITPRRKLFKHQEEALNFAWSRKRCLLALEMGLGKTLTTIELIEHIIKTENKLNWWLVAPYGAQQDWKRQLVSWQAKFKFIVISTYESLHKWMEVLLLDNNHPPDGVIFDESIKIKNPSSQRSQVANELARLIRNSNGYIICLSGSPASKNPIDWWHQIEILQPGFIREGDPRKFTLRYANVEKVDHGFGEHLEIQSWKEDELVKLGKRLSPIVIVRKKKDCLDLPDKIFEEYQCIVSQELLRQAFVVAELAENGISALEKLRELSDGFQYSTDRDSELTTSASVGNDNLNTQDVRTTTKPDGFDSETDRLNCPNATSVNTPTKRTTIFNPVNPKLELIKELLDFYSIENGGPGRLVIYAVYHGSIDLLVEFCTKEVWLAVSIDGRGWSDPKILDYFNASDQNNIVIIAHPGSVYGLNLQQTHALIYYSNSFNIDHRTQSLDRRDRPGMDITKGTRVVDILCLPTDKYILDRLKLGISVQNITLEEIKKCLSM